MSDRPALSDADLLARFQLSTNRPPCSQHHGFEILSINQAEKRVEALFSPRPEFANPMGVIQGGYLCAMLDDVMSVAGLVASGMTHMMPTLEMKVSFIAPARPGPKLRGVGRVIRLGRSIAFLEGELFSDDAVLLARASATAQPKAFKAAE